MSFSDIWNEIRRLDARVDDHEKRIGHIEAWRWQILAAASGGGLLGKLLDLLGSGLNLW